MKMSDEQTIEYFINLMNTLSQDEEILARDHDGKFQLETMESAFQGFKMGLSHGQYIEREGCANTIMKLGMRLYPGGHELFKKGTDAIMARNDGD